MHDAAAGCRLTDKRDGLDQGVFGQCFAGVFTEPLYAIQDAVRQTCIVCNFGQHHGAIGRPLRRLVDDGATCRQCGCNLPGRQHERRVPWSDDANGTDGLPYGIVDVFIRGQRLSVACLRRHVRKEAKIRGASNCRFAHELERLS